MEMSSPSKETIDHWKEEIEKQNKESVTPHVTGYGYYRPLNPIAPSSSLTKDTATTLPLLSFTSLLPLPTEVSLKLVEEILERDTNSAEDSEMETMSPPIVAPNLELPHCLKYKYLFDPPNRSPLSTTATSCAGGSTVAIDTYQLTPTKSVVAEMDGDGNEKLNSPEGGRKKQYVVA
jgi:hypothetical protein